MDGLKDYIYKEINEYLDNPTVKQKIYEKIIEEVVMITDLKYGCIYKS